MQTSPEKTKLPIIGVIYKNSELNFESRHLGLIPAKEKNLKSKIEKTSKIISDSLDIEKIIQIMRNPIQLQKKSKIVIKKPEITIAIALDSSFNFYYRDNLEALRREGANLKFFSLIHDKKVPISDGIYIGGGFPEIRAARARLRRHPRELWPYAERSLLAHLLKLEAEGKAVRDGERWRLTG